MSGDVLRMGLVGLGDIAVRAHLPALAREPRVALGHREFVMTKLYRSA